MNIDVNTIIDSLAERIKTLVKEIAINEATIIELNKTVEELKNQLNESDNTKV